MGLKHEKELRQIAKNFCRELRKYETPAERIFWEIVRDRRFLSLKFYRQFPLFYDLQGKESFFIADFYTHTLKTVIELDGSIHENRLAEDERRTQILNYLGCRVIRFRNEEILSEIQAVKKKLEVLFPKVPEYF